MSSQWDLELFSGTWERWIGEDSARTVQTMSGCYSVIHPGTNLKIISLNTGFWYKAVCFSSTPILSFNTQKATA